MYANLHTTIPGSASTHLREIPSQENQMENLCLSQVPQYIPLAIIYVEPNKGNYGTHFSLGSQAKW